MQTHKKDHFDIEITDNAINRAHRIGRYDHNKKRPIIVAFQEYTLMEAITRKGNVWKDANFSVSKDYPIEITRAIEIILASL